MGKRLLYKLAELAIKEGSPDEDVYKRQVSGFLLVGYTGTSFLDVGTSYNTKTIAAVVIGGTAITGGKGGYLRCV